MYSFLSVYLKFLKLKLKFLHLNPPLLIASISTELYSKGFFISTIYLYIYRAGRPSSIYFVHSCFLGSRSSSSIRPTARLWYKNYIYFLKINVPKSSMKKTTMVSMWTAEKVSKNMPTKLSLPNTIQQNRCQGI